MSKKKNAEEAKEVEYKELVEACPLPEVLSFKGIRAKVMEEVWKKSEEMETKGIPMTNDDFSNLLKETWKVAKAEWIPKAKAEYEECRKKLFKELIADEVASEEKEKLKELGVSVEED